MTRALDLGKTPKELQFFHGGVSKKLNDRLFSQGIDDSSTKFASYFMNEECRELLKRNKLMIHIEIRNTFFDNRSSQGSIYDFFYSQQDYSKKLLGTKFTFSVDYDTYISEYVMAIKSTNVNKYDMLPNKNSKFPFYYFDGFLERQLRSVARVRHTIVSKDEHRLLELQKRKLALIHRKIFRKLILMSFETLRVNF